MSEEDEIRIAAVGKTGAGKSTLGNALIGDGSFNVGEYSESETTQTTTKEGAWNGSKVKYADTPGLFDTKAENDEVDKEIGKCVEQLHGLDVVFYVINLDARFTNEELNSVDGLNRIFGDDVTHYMIVVFTHRKPRSNRTEHEKMYIEKANTDLKTVLQKCSGRYTFIYHDNETDSKFDVNKIMELAFTLKKANHNKNYDSEMYDQAVKQAKAQKEREAEEKAAKEKKEKELEKQVQEITEEKGRLEKERAEDKIKQLKLERQRLQERERDLIERLIFQLQVYRYTLSNYDIYTEKVRGESNHALKALTDKSTYDRIGQIGSSMGDMATSTGAVLGALTGPLGFGVMLAPCVIGIASSAYFNITSGALTEQVCNISSDDDRHLSNISTKENKILDLLRNLGSKRLKSDIYQAIDCTKELKYRLQTVLENKKSGIDWKNELTWLAGHASKGALIGFGQQLTRTVKTVATKTTKTMADKTLKTVATETTKIMTEKTVKTVATETTKTMTDKTVATGSVKAMTNKTVNTVATETTKTMTDKTGTTLTDKASKFLTSETTKKVMGVAQKAVFVAGLAFDAKNIYDNTSNYKEPEIVSTLKMKIHECDKTRDNLSHLMLDIDHVITILTDSNPGA